LIHAKWFLPTKAFFAQKSYTFPTQTESEKKKKDEGESGK